MMIGYTPLLSSFVILNSIEFSSQSQPPDEPAFRDRSRSPTLRQTFPKVLGFIFEDLAYIRLIPHNHPNRIFEFRKYVFPPDKQIQLRSRYNVPHPMPPGEQIVLSTSDSDVCALLEKTASKHTILRAIYTQVFGMSVRVKINMDSGLVAKLTEEEIAECPVSNRNLTIANCYGISRLSLEPKHEPDSDSHPNDHRFGPSSSSSPSVRYIPPAQPRFYNRSNSPTLRQTFPFLFGYRFEDLEFIRLIPHNYPLREFELRIYVFPQDKPIGLRTRTRLINSMPTGNQIVLSTSNGDICAILLRSLGGSTILRPIFTSVPRVLARVKINMISGEFKELTKEETAECPVTNKEVITKFYKVSRV